MWLQRLAGDVSTRYRVNNCICIASHPYQSTGIAAAPTSLRHAPHSPPPSATPDVVAATAATHRQDDPYKTLGLDRNASQDDIRRAYKSPAGGPTRGDAEEFNGSRPPATLGDEEKRKRYDAAVDFSGASREGFPPLASDSATLLRLFEEMFGAGFAEVRNNGAGGRASAARGQAELRSSICSGVLFC